VSDCLFWLISLLLDLDPDQHSHYISGSGYKREKSLRIRIQNTACRYVGLVPYGTVGTRQTYIQTSTCLLLALFLLLAGCSQELPGVFTALAFLAGGAILILK